MKKILVSALVLLTVGCSDFTVNISVAPAAEPAGFINLGGIPLGEGGIDPTTGLPLDEEGGLGPIPPMNLDGIPLQSPSSGIPPCVCAGAKLAVQPKYRPSYWWIARGKVADGLVMYSIPLQNSVIGEYEFKEDGDIYKTVFLENGIGELYKNDEKLSDDKWKIADGKGNTHAVIHVGKGLVCQGLLVEVFRINKDKSITGIAQILNGKRTDYLEEKQETWKKIK